MSYPEMTEKSHSLELFQATSPQCRNPFCANCNRLVSSLAGTTITRLVIAPPFRVRNDEAHAQSSPPPTRWYETTATSKFAKTKYTHGLRHHRPVGMRLRQLPSSQRQSTRTVSDCLRLPPRAPPPPPLVIARSAATRQSRPVHGLRRRSIRHCAQPHRSRYREERCRTRPVFRGGGEFVVMPLR
jgi:hypothetical protein